MLLDYDIFCYNKRIMEHFLDKNYPDLAGSRPVARAVKKAREQGEKPYTRDELIDSYLARLSTLIHDKRGFDLLKRRVLSEYVTKPEDIPEGYWKLQENVIEKRDHLSHRQNISDREKEEMKRRNAENALLDQKASLERWVDYLASSKSDFMSDDLKYWVFRHVVKMEEFNNETKEFGKHSGGTTKQFPDVNEEALSYVIDAIQNKYRRKAHEFDFDIQENDQQNFKQFLKKEDFAKLYAWANTFYNPIPERLLKIKDGEWRKFDRNSNPEELSKTIRGKGTGWCSAGTYTAKTELRDGDFYVYYSKDDEGNAVIPRIAISMEGDEIAEICGIAPKQNLDSNMEEVLEKKLEEFPDNPNKEYFLKKKENMSRLSKMAEKEKNTEELTKDELIFLYEQQEKMSGFGYEKDGRTEKLKTGRKNRIADYCVMYDCKPENVAVKPEDISENTVVYIGNLIPKNVGILNNRKNPIVIDGDTNFYGCASLVSLPENIIFNGTANFEKCTSLSEIPKNAIFNDDAYFFGCTSLVEVPDETIFKMDVNFYGCTSLAEIPEAVIKNTGGTITLPEHLRKKYEKYPNVVF